MSKEQLYTPEGYQKLVDELAYLSTTRREEIKKDIAEARSFGDLSENAEYDAARNEQAKVEARIKEKITKSSANEKKVYNFGQGSCFFAKVCKKMRDIHSHVIKALYNYREMICLYGFWRNICREKSIPCAHCRASWRLPCLC